MAKLLTGISEYSSRGGGRIDGAEEEAFLRLRNKLEELTLRSRTVGNTSMNPNSHVVTDETFQVLQK